MADQMTSLDLAFAAMQVDEADDVARLRYYGELANAELCLLLDKEAGATSLTPKVYDLEGGPFVLVFEGEERLAGFVGAVAPCAHLAGRVIAGLLAGKGIGLAINLEGASSLLIPADAVDWLEGVLTQSPDVVDAVPEAVAAPGDLPADLLQALAANLAMAAGQADAAYLAAVTYQTGRRGHILVFAGAKVRAEAALVRATGEALVFSGLDAGEVDVAFLAAGDAMVAALHRVALRFDMALPEAAQPVAMAAPGSDPDKPPKLR